MRTLTLASLDGWDSIEQQAMGLGQIGDIKVEVFFWIMQSVPKLLQGYGNGL